MKRKVLVLALFALALSLAALTMVGPTSLLLLGVTWLDRSAFALDGATISLRPDEYFYPGNTTELVLVGRLFSRNAILAVEKQSQSAGERDDVVNAECGVFKCRGTRNASSINRGKRIDMTEQHYEGDDHAAHVQVRYWLEGSRYVVRFRGRAAEFARFEGTIDRFLEQLSGPESAKGPFPGS